MVKILSGVPEGSFVRSSSLPGSPAAARKALSRAAGEGTLLFITPGLYYRGAMTRYGMATPSIQEVVTAVFSREGVGPAGSRRSRVGGHHAVPATFHVATLKPVAAIAVYAVSRESCSNAIEPEGNCAVRAVESARSICEGVGIAGAAVLMLSGRSHNWENCSK